MKAAGKGYSSCILLSHTPQLCEGVWFSKMARCILIKSYNSIMQGVWFSKRAKVHLHTIEGRYIFSFYFIYGREMGSVRFTLSFYLIIPFLREGYDSVRLEYD